MDKLKVYHFHNGSGGGVLSVIKNVIKFSENDLIENHVVHVINKKKTAFYKADKIDAAVSEIIFYYNPKNNFYYTCKQLAKLLPNKKAVIVAHDWIELGMVSNLGLQNRVICFLHGDYEYYYQLAKKNEIAINTFICVSNSIKEKLNKEIINRKNDIKYLRFPVPQANQSSEKFDTKNIIFIGRLTKEKGYNLIPKIANNLFAQNIHLNWHVVGTGSENIFEDFNEAISVFKYGEIPNNSVRDLLQKMNFLILPSLVEGMPVSVIESMKAGVVVLVNDIEGGIQEIVIDNKTGYKIKQNSTIEYENHLKILLINFEFTQVLAENAKQLAVELFEPYNNTRIIEKEYFGENEKIKKANKVYGSRLDHPLIPNFITKTIRNFIK